jgi:hypothetical protein
VTHDEWVAEQMHDPEFRREYERLGPVYEPLLDGKPRSWLFWRWFGVGDSLGWPDWYIRLGKRLRAL